MDLVAYALCKKYVDDTMNSLGAVRGAPCTVDSVQDMGDSCVITFGWTGTDGTHQTSTATIPYGLNDEEKVQFQNDLKEYIDQELTDVSQLDGVHFLTDESGNTLWTGVDSIPVPSIEKAGYVLGVNSNGQYELLPVNSILNL